MADDPVRLCKDPLLPWPTAFPYERVNARLREVGHAGLSPSSSAAEVNDALFDLQMADAPPEDVEAWDELHNLGRRLLLDFFLYQLPAAEEDEGSGLPDLSPLAAAPPDLELTPAASFDPGPAPQPLPLDAAALALPPVDVGPVAYDEAVVFGGHD